MKIVIEVEFDAKMKVRAVEISTPLRLSSDERYDALEAARKAVSKTIKDELEMP